jgi:hypothetical protein
LASFLQQQHAQLITVVTTHTAAAAAAAAALVAIVSQPSPFKSPLYNNFRSIDEPGGRRSVEIQSRPYFYIRGAIYHIGDFDDC